MSDRDTEAIVREYVDACNAADSDRLLAILHPQVELHEAKALPGAVSAVGFDAVVRYLERFNAHWTEVHWEPVEIRSHGDRALMRARLRLKGRRSGIDVDREWVYLLTVRDGKLLRQDGYDTMPEGEAALES